MTSLYHAYANRPELAYGTIVLITGGSERIALQPDDRLSIETPEYNRFTALVISGTPTILCLRLANGTAIWLNPANAGWAEKFKISDGFSRQPWVVVRQNEVTL